MMMIPTPTRTLFNDTLLLLYALLMNSLHTWYTSYIIIIYDDWDDTGQAAPF